MNTFCHALKLFTTCKFAISGPEDTPYSGGLFIFDTFFPSDYPENCPKVNMQTTGQGSVRFNPNLYNCGKVCLSLLGTWRGEAGETWDPKCSTLLQVSARNFFGIFVFVKLERHQGNQLRRFNT